MTSYILIFGKFIEGKFKTAQNSKYLRLNGHRSFEFQTRNYITCFGYIRNHPRGQENHTQKYINMVLITV